MNPFEDFIDRIINFLLSGAFNLFQIMDLIEKAILKRAIKMRTTRADTARMLGINRTTLIAKIKKHELQDVKHKCQGCKKCDCGG